MSIRPPKTSTSTVSVFTRHSPDCDRKDEPQWRRCKCRKWLYIYHQGRDSRVTAHTRSWEQAEREAQKIRDSWDPVKTKLQELERLKQKHEVEALRIEQALDDWLKSRAPKSKRQQTSGTATVYKTCARKIKDWAAEQKLVFLSEVTPAALDSWRSAWSPEAARRDDRMSATTQKAFLGHLRQFFWWATKLRHIERDPSDHLEAIEGDQKQTLPLTQEQFEELLAATDQYDEGQRRECDRLGHELRALFLLMRWTGLRIGDAAALPRRAIVGNRLTTRMKKSGRPISVIVPDHVVRALNDLPARPGIHADYFFWSRTCTLASLSTTWTQKIARLNEKHLSFRDEHGKPLEFHSHMLRDTFAVEMLLAGVPLEDVSKMLGHASIRITERYYSPWVKQRQHRLERKMIEAMGRMGASVTLAGDEGGSR